MDSSVQRWLGAEDGEDDTAADAAFLAVMASLPRIAPEESFIRRTETALTRARVRRRAVAMLGRAAAAVLITVASLASAYWFLPLMIRGGIGGVVLLTQGMVSLVTTFGDGMTWWSIAARVVGVLGESLATPRTTLVFVAIEFVAATALYMLHRLLDQDAVSIREAA